MIDTLINLLRKDNLYHQAMAECHAMLDTDWTMFEASIASLRQSDSADVDFDIYATDHRINAAERDVRKKVMTHLALAGKADLAAGLALVSVVIDIERIGDYTKNIYTIACNHPSRLHGGSLEPRLNDIESKVSALFRATIDAFKTGDPEVARRVMNEYKEEVAANCETITMEIVAGKLPDLSAADAASLALYARYLKRIAAHSRNIVTSVVNPFHRIGYREKHNPSATES